MGVLCCLGAWGARRVGFDINPLRLQAKNAESVIWEQKLVKSASHSTLTACVLARSLDEVVEKSKALSALPSVLETENILSVLPKDQEDKIPLLRKILVEIPELRNGAAGAASPGPGPGGPGKKGLGAKGAAPRSSARQSLSRAPAVADAAAATSSATASGAASPAESAVEAAGPLNTAGLMDILQRIGFKMQPDRAGEWGAERPLLEQMHTVSELIAGIVEKLQDNGSEDKPLEEFRKRFRLDLEQMVSFLRTGASASSMHIEDIPQGIREHLLAGGVYLIQVYPKGSIWNEQALSKFVKEVQSVDPDAVGDPISLYVFASAYREACIKATLYSVAAIVIMLAAPFGNVAMVLLALLPLAVGALWTVGIMGAVHIDFNLANSIFLPLVFGAGIEYAVIILHRWREGRVAPGRLPFSTGKGVILAALTTTMGFGTLMISSHRGIFSLGFVAWTGSLCILVAAVILLPAFLAFSKRPHKCNCPPEGDEKE
jgi:hypothetical protein